MMRYILALALVAMLAVPCFADEEYGGRVTSGRTTIFDGITAAAGGTANGTVITPGRHPRGSSPCFGGTITGSGTLSINLFCSMDGGTTYAQPESHGNIISPIASSLTSSSGNGGYVIIPFAVPDCDKWFLQMEETGSSNNATISGGVVRYQ